MMRKRLTREGLVLKESWPLLRTACGVAALGFAALVAVCLWVKIALEPPAFWVAVLAGPSVLLLAGVVRDVEVRFDVGLQLVWWKQANWFRTCQARIPFGAIVAVDILGHRSRSESDGSSTAVGGENLAYTLALRTKARSYPLSVQLDPNLPKVQHMQRRLSELLGMAFAVDGTHVCAGPLMAREGENAPPAMPSCHTRGDAK